MFIRHLIIISIYVVALQSVRAEEGLPRWFYHWSGGDKLVAVGVSDFGMDSVQAIEQASVRARALLALCNTSVTGTYVSTNIGVTENGAAHQSKTEVLYAANFLGVLTDSNHLVFTDTAFTENHEALVRVEMQAAPFDSTANVVFATKLARLIGFQPYNDNVANIVDKIELTAISDSSEKLLYEYDVVHRTYQSLFKKELAQVKNFSLNKSFVYPAAGRGGTSKGIPLNEDNTEILNNGLWPAMIASLAKSMTTSASFYNNTIKILTSTGVTSDVQARLSRAQTEVLQSSKNINANRFRFTPTSLSINDKNELSISLRVHCHDTRTVPSMNSQSSDEDSSNQKKKQPKEGWKVHGHSDVNGVLTDINERIYNNPSSTTIHTITETSAYGLNTAIIIALELSKLKVASLLETDYHGLSSTNISDRYIEQVMSGKSTSALTIDMFHPYYLFFRPVDGDKHQVRLYLFYQP